MHKAAAFLALLCVTPAACAATRANGPAATANATALRATHAAPTTRPDEAAALRSLLGHAVTYGAAIVLAPEQSLAAVAEPDLYGAIARSITP